VVGVAGLMGVTVMIIWYIWNIVEKAKSKLEHKVPEPDDG
jgi:hypothetical protein